MDFQPVIDSLGRIITDIADFIPRLVNGLIIVVIGFLIAWLVRFVVRFIFHRIGLDALAEKAGINRVLQQLRIKVSLSKVIARLIYYYLLLSFATEASKLIQFTSIAELLTNILHFIPQAVVATIIIILGSLLARFLGETIAAVAGSVNITYSKGLGKIIEYAVVAFVIILALSTLGIDISILTSSMTIIVASAGLAIALTFAFGARETARNIIAGYSVQQRIGQGQQITMGDYSGVVRSTSGAYTVVEVRNEAGPSQEVAIPNSMLLQSVVQFSRNPDETSPNSTPATDTGSQPEPNQENNSAGS